MKRFSKVIAFALLLAVVVSAFGVFSAFAADPTESERQVLFDMDSEDSHNLKETADDDAETEGSQDNPEDGVDAITKVTENGVSYWHWTSDMDSTADYLSVYYYSTHPGVYVTNKTTTDGDTTTVKNARNTKYLVFDFDIATDTVLPDNLYINMTFRDNANTRKSDNNIKFYLLNEGANVFSIQTANKNTYNSPFYMPKNDWTDVTVVWDFTDYDESTNAIGSVTYYVYLNGQLYAKNKVSNDVVGAINNLEYFRLGTTVAGESAANNSFNVSNLTFSSFDPTYTGSLDTVGSSLEMHPELAYCLENKPVTPAAKIERAGQADIVCPTLYELQENIALGDKVTLYKSVEEAIFVPDNKDDATTLGVTFVDENGTAIGAEGALVTVALLYEIDMDAYDWAIVKDGTTVIAGTTTAENTYYDSTNTDAPLVDEFVTTLSNNKGTATTQIVLFDDLTVYGSNSASITVAGVMHLNLNGHKLNVDLKGSKNLFQATKSKTLILENGEFVFAHDTASYYLFSNANGKCIFYDLNMNITEGTFIDQRFGVIIYSHCIVDAAVDLASSKTQEKNRVYFTIDTCEIDGASDIIGFGHTSGYGSVKLYGFIMSSEITNCSAIVNYKERVHTKNATTENGLANDNYVRVNVVDTTAKCEVAFRDNPAWQAQHADVVASNYSVTTAVEYNVYNSTIDASNYLFDRQHESIGYYTPEIYESVSYDFVMNVDGASKMTAGKALADLIYLKTYKGVTTVKNFADATGKDVLTATLNFEEGALLNYTAESTDYSSYSVANPPYYVNAEEGSEIANTGIYDGYKYIVTSNYTDNNYTMADGETSGQFFWNDEAGDNIDITRFATLTAAGATYKYEWEKAETAVGYDFTETLAPNFKPSVSLSTNGYLALNVFVPDGVAIKNGAYAVENGVTLGQYGDAATYNMAKIEAIDPTDANVNYAVDVVITGAYGDTLEKAVSVSVIKYAASVLANYTDENSAENKYAVALLGYIKSVMEYADADYTEALAAIATVLGDKTAAAATKPTAVENKGSANGVTYYAMNLGGSINWVITAEAGATYTVKVGNGNAVERTVGEDGKLYISVRAYEVYETVTVSDGENTLTFNISNYYNEDTTTSEAKVVVDALAAYAEAAVVYKAQLDAAN